MMEWTVSLNMNACVLLCPENKSVKRINKIRGRSHGLYRQYNRKNDNEQLLV